MMTLIVLWIFKLLCSVAAMNWGMYIFFDFNLVTYVAQKIPFAYADKILYGVISFAGLYLFLSLFIFWM